MHLSTQSIFAILFHEHSVECFLRRFAGVLVVASIVLYAYLAGASVLHAVIERSVTKDVEMRQGSLAELEREYSDLTREITETRGYEFGLVRATHKQFVTRGAFLSDARVTVQNP